MRERKNDLKQEKINNSAKKMKEKKIAEGRNEQTQKAIQSD
jgi:hypothetical protein